MNWVGFARSSRSNLSDGRRWRSLRPEQRIFRFDCHASGNLVVRGAGESADIYRRSTAGQSKTGRVAKATGFDCLPASNPARLWRCVRCSDRIRKATSGAGAAGAVGVRSTGIGSPLHPSLQGGHYYLSRSARRATLSLHCGVDFGAGTRERISEPSAGLSGARRRVAAVT